MAKKTTKKTKTPLTKIQIDQLAGDLLATTKNVYRRVETIFGSDALCDEDTFKRLAAQGGIFRCVECSTWQSVDEKAEDYLDTCQGCADENHAAEEDETE